ncbi:methyltransferase family protein [Silvibacterium dinghuense]|uniref:Isoprenylcysteine carboxylmethyltransferase family protein n=1 Tax=Silvibacterium dinghuense TaxID=1560006 RepID=A0A4Q1SCX6_9BACT|nr:isoprenylcysteine carboxylmethyltransferase family protein [Silvibacterium dinghuense]RXS95066.1 isoprenylcysteine carboxylmethyltransferase family protein [Silvibacterium dinghuense]GGH10311.1 protein-S-isoprenylcysteine methyltransferase [Silvibacterium dinghuense]
MEMLGRTITWMWVVFLLGWLFSAFTTKRSVQQQSGGSRLVQSLIMLLGVALLMNYRHFLGHGWLAAPLVPNSLASVGTGAALTFGGLAFCVWARLILGRNWSGVVTIKQDHELIVRGPYRIVRHPIYTGLLIAFLGTATAIGFAYSFAGVLVIAISFWLKLKVEEQFMLQQFGAQYTDYRRHTRALIPFVL